MRRIYWSVLLGLLFGAIIVELVNYFYIRPAIEILIKNEAFCFLETNIFLH